MNKHGSVWMAAARGIAGPLALLLHELVEGVLVQGHALLLHHLQRQVDREAVGII